MSSITNVDLTNVRYMLPPGWAQECLKRLCNATGFKGSVGLAVHIGEWPERIGVTDQPDAYARIPANEGDPCVIVLPEWAEDSDKWRSAICHEFAHVLHREVDEFATAFIPKERRGEYWERVESIIKPFAILLLVAGKLNIEWVEDEGEQVHGRPE